MKQRSREINIFSMSALDLFASALGAFILIAVVLFPFYPNTGDSKERVADVKAKLEEVESELAQCRNSEDECLKRAQSLGDQVNKLQSQLDALSGQANELQQCTDDLAQCEEKLSKTFLAIVIQWPSKKHDVDLHVIDPAGVEFYYEKARVPGRPGELSADTTSGPGVEIWEITEAEVGTYKIKYNFFARHGNSEPAVVKGGVYHRDGHFRLAPKTLNSKRKYDIAEVVVNTDGSIEINQL